MKDQYALVFLDMYLIQLDGNFRWLPLSHPSGHPAYLVDDPTEFNPIIADHKSPAHIHQTAAELPQIKNRGEFMDLVIKAMKR